MLNLPPVRGLLSSDHFSADGTLIEAWASMKSFVPKDGGGPPAAKGDDQNTAECRARVHGKKRKNYTYCSPIDPDSRLFPQRPGKEAKLCHMGRLMIENRNRLTADARVTKADGTAERETALAVIEDNARPGSTLGGDKNEEPFGRMKTVGGLGKSRHCGRRLVDLFLALTAIAYNPIWFEPQVDCGTGTSLSGVMKTKQKRAKLGAFRAETLARFHVSLLQTSKACEQKTAFFITLTRNAVLLWGY